MFFKIIYLLKALFLNKYIKILGLVNFMLKKVLTLNVFSVILRRT